MLGSDILWLLIVLLAMTCGLVAARYAKIITTAQRRYQQLWLIEYKDVRYFCKIGRTYGKGEYIAFTDIHQTHIVHTFDVKFIEHMDN